MAQALTLQTVATAGGYFSPAIRDIVDWGLRVGAKHLTVSVPEEYSLKVELQDGMPDDMAELATAVAAARTAMVMSIETGVKTLHPSWNDTMIQEEVQRIHEEEGLKLPGDVTTGDIPPEETDESETSETDPAGNDPAAQGGNAA